MEISPAVRAFLAEPHFAVLATIGKGGVPQQTVVWYELRGDTIMLNTKRGRVKDLNLLRDPRASFCIEDGYRYVTIVGACALDDDQERAHADIAALAIRYHGRERGERQAANFRKEERVTIHLRPERVEAYGFGE
ncbi:MAG TPA: PPOX class F420-dependent oxidoreductase [Thermomicrobiales bacterium]|nr:PPOX class F420-dependent oxidoreductase [Thermomicrobiales bacterium]